MTSVTLRVVAALDVTITSSNNQYAGIHPSPILRLTLDTSRLAVSLTPSQYAGVYPSPILRLPLDTSRLTPSGCGCGLQGGGRGTCRGGEGGFGFIQGGGAQGFGPGGGHQEQNARQGDEEAGQVEGQVIAVGQVVQPPCNTERQRLVKLYVR